MPPLEQELIDHWRSIKKKDAEKLRAFFHAYRYLSLSDIATLVGIAIDTLVSYRKAAGITVKPKHKAKVTDFVIPAELEPDVDAYVDTKEWWEKHYKRFGYRKLARLAGFRDVTYVAVKLRKRGIPLLGHRDLNKIHRCNNFEWLNKYYTQMGYGLHRLARMAGVAKTTIKAWLAKHNIPRKYKNLIYVGENSCQQNDSKK